MSFLQLFRNLKCSESIDMLKHGDSQADLYCLLGDKLILLVLS